MSSAESPSPRNYSHITSLAAAQSSAANGELFPVLLFPAEFGGEEIAPNIVYVPPGIPEIKDQITGTLIRFYEGGLINKLSISPTYKGKSLVPATIGIKAWHSDKDGGLNPSIEIW